jgi:hypothetical protein
LIRRHRRHRGSRSRLAPPQRQQNCCGLR